MIIAGVVVLAMSAAPAFRRGPAKANMAEVELGKLAEMRATSDPVKTFAKRMVVSARRA